MEDGDVSTLWNDLSLGALLNNDSNFVQEVVNTHLQQSTCPNSLARDKHKKMLEKPTFGVLMDRYSALPHDPIAIQPRSIERLADPIRGRFSNYDRLVEEIQVPPPVGFQSPNNRSRSNSPEHMRHHVPSTISPSRLSFSKNLEAITRGANKAADKKAMDSFFLTANNDGGDADDEDSVDNRREKEKQQVYARVKEILSPKRPQSPPLLNPNAGPFGPRGVKPLLLPQKFQDPLIKAVKKLIRPNRMNNNRNNVASNINIARRQKVDKSKFTINGIDSKKERKSGKMLHASQIKPLDKSKSEAKMKGRRAWNDRVVPTEMLHSK
jgi:hypothetical protein